MTKYIILLVVLIGAGGVFLYATQTAEAPMQPSQGQENPFGDGSNVVGSFDDSPDEVEDELEDEDDDMPASGGTGATGGSTGGAGSAGSTGGTTTVITRVQLAAHNTQSDCWIAYKGVVYDITAWLPRHPGSAAAIAPYCGKAEEFAAAFNKQHGTSKDARLQREGTVEGTLGN